MRFFLQGDEDIGDVQLPLELGLTLDPATAVVFHNRKKDTLVLYTLDESGDRCITKKLKRGAFLVPVPAEGRKYVVLEASKVASLFRA